MISLSSSRKFVPDVWISDIINIYMYIFFFEGGGLRFAPWGGAFSYPVGPGEQGRKTGRANNYILCSYNSNREQVWLTAD